MIEEDLEPIEKIIVVGNGGVGKTSLIQRFCKGQFTTNYKKTIGTDFLEKNWYVAKSDTVVKLMLFDTAGQEEFDSLTRQYYRGASGCVLAFSTTDRSSFEAVTRWRDKVESECGSIHMALMQNKIDLVDESVVTQDEGKDLAAQLGVKFFATCVKNNTNVSEVFDYLAEQFLVVGPVPPKPHLVVAGSLLPAGISPSSPPSSSAAAATPLESIQSTTRLHRSGSTHSNSDNAVAKPPSVQERFSKPGARPVGAAGQRPVVSLEPSRQRTGGRKERSCSGL